MNRSIPFVGLVLSVMLVVAGCSTPQPMTSFTPQDFDAQLRSGKYEPKVDNFIVVFDASSSMNEAYEGSVHTGHSKFDVAKDLVHRMNVTMPALPIQGGMTAFGLDPNVSKSPATVVYGPTDYTQAGMEEGLNAISMPGGTTPLGLGLTSAGEMLKDARGEVAVLVERDCAHGAELEVDIERRQFLCLHPFERLAARFVQPPFARNGAVCDGIL